MTTAVVAVVVIGGLYLAREVVVPIALALLLSFVLAPLVRLLQHWYVPRIAAVLIVTLFGFSTIFGFGAVMVSQVTQLAEQLPVYQTTLREKIQTLRGAAAGKGTLERASEVLQDLSKEIDRPRSGPTVPSLGQRERPIPVEVWQPDPGAIQVLSGLITPLLHPLTTTGIVVIFVIFILMQRQDLRNRLVRLAGAHDLQRTTAALDDAGQRLSRLFLTQLALNAGFGLIIGIGLWLIGVPSAPLWGMLAMIMRFVPYIGALISAIFPLVLAAAVGPGWSMVLATAALFLIAEPLVGHVIEPFVYGQSTGLSPVAVILSATFWTWLWGPIGLVLATPLTLCAVVLGRHVDGLKFLEVMLGDEPPLTPAELAYQRMLARDPVEAVEQARVYLRNRPLTSYYDEILMEGLKLAQADAGSAQLDDGRMTHIRDAVLEIIDDLTTHKDRAVGPPKSESEDSIQSPLARLEQAESGTEEMVIQQEWKVGKPVLCIPGASLLDEAAALMLAQLAERQGIGARAEKAGALSMSRIFGWEIENVSLICLCYIGDVSSAQIRYAIRRIERRVPDVPVLLALFGGTNQIEAEESGNANFVAHSLNEAMEEILVHAHKKPEARATTAPHRADDTKSVTPGLSAA